MAVPACCRIWARVSAAVSEAKSVSRMRLREAERFSDTVCRLLMVDSKRFWMAPNVPRSSLTDFRAASMLRMVLLAEPAVFTVVDQLSTLDKSSWDYLSQYGSEDDVMAYLEQNNVYRLDLARIAWRCRESAAFFRRAIAALSARRAWDDTLWSYGLHHNDTAAARQYLLHREDFLSQCGQWLEWMHMGGIRSTLAGDIDASACEEERNLESGGHAAVGYGQCDRGQLVINPMRDDDN